MNYLKQGLSLALLGAGLTALPGLQVGAAAEPAAADRSLVQQMRSAAEGGVTISTEAATDVVGFVRAREAGGDLLAALPGDSTASAARKATAYVERFGEAFGLADDQVEQEAVDRNALGWTVTFSQSYDGVPVFGSMLRANLDESGALTSVNGFAVPDLDLSTDPSITLDQAGQAAVELVRSDPAEGHGGGATDVSGLEARDAELVVYRTGSTQGRAEGENLLAYSVEVTNERSVRDQVILDARSGKPLNRWSMGTHALRRQLDEASIDDGGTPDDPDDDTVAFDTVWEEGDALPGNLNADQENLVRSAGESYWFFQNSFGRDSYDGEGALMRTVNNDPRISCPNANWNGVTTNYCDGVTSDDVVAHEWGHAYTEYTSGLIYQYQSGALNEGYSDIWGETVDLINAREDEEEGDIDAVRPDGQCSKYTRGEIGATINSPASIAGPCAGAAAAAFGPVFDAEGVTTDVLVAEDAENTDGPSATDGCSAYTNAADVAGSFAYVDRGTCTFAQKVAVAEDAGATGIVVGDNAPGRAPISMSGTSDLYGVMVTQADGTKIKSVDGPVNMTIKDVGTDERVDSYRWLVGEKSPAFGGAIRDMWNPTCYGDPSKVSDAEYDCDPNLDDNGGVHGNSGVPNHAYALMVDGGTSNGVEVAGLGLDQAAAIWWRAQTSYLTPTSDFGDAADGLEASCRDLVGQPINQLSTTANATPTPAEPIVAADCESVTAAVSATEMREEPVQCNFQPILKQGAPASPCGPGSTETSVWSEDFEDGLAGWEADQEVVSGFGEPWVAADGPAESSNTTSVAYGPAPDEGDCQGGDDDFSSRDSMISPEIELPSGSLTPRMTFDHYIATEAGFDGGNVKVSLNGGAFQVVPAKAFTFNPYNATLTTAAEENTNPMAGEPGFTATDGGELSGSWGQSQVNLGAMGAKAGDTVQVRFDIGRDGCGGIDGWYVDNVEIVACSKAAVKKKASTTVANAPKSLPYSRDFSVRTKVTQRPRGAAAGFVKVLFKGDVVGRGKLNGKGRAVIEVRKNIGVGQRKLVAVYTGNAQTKGSRDSVTIRVTRRR